MISEGVSGRADQARSSPRAYDRDAWKAKESLTKEAAMRAYVATLLQVSTGTVVLPSARLCSPDGLARAHPPACFCVSVDQVLKRYKDRKQARALIREFEMTGSITAGSGRVGGRGVGDSGVSGWTGVEGSQTGRLPGLSRSVLARPNEL